jgi:hypothetical protein
MFPAMFPAMFLGGHYPASAEGLLVVDFLGFDAAPSDDPGLSAAMLASVLSHADRLAEDIASLKGLASARRVADFLARQIDVGKGAATLVLPHDMALSAAGLGMTPETSSRAFAALRRFGVEARRENVSVADVSVLCAYAGAGARGSGGEGP